MLMSVRKHIGKITLAALLAGSVLVLAPAQVQAKTADCTPGPDTDLAGCNYANANLADVDFAGSNLTGANLSDTDLNGTDFDGSTLKRADLLGAGIVEDCTTSTCAYTDLSGTFPNQNIEFDTAPNFTDADLKAANLSTVRLRGGTVDTGELCLPHFPCLQDTANYPDAVLTGVASGGITGTPTSLPAGWELIDGYLTQTIAPPTITTSSLAPGSVGVAYNTDLTATGGNPPYKWSITGALPAGLHLSASSGTIAGNPRVAGTYSFTAVVTDSKTAAKPHTRRTATQPLSITVN